MRRQTIAPSEDSVLNWEKWNAANSPTVRAAAQTILEDRGALGLIEAARLGELRNGKPANAGDWVSQRTRQILDDRKAAGVEMPPADAENQAVRELATLATVGVWTGTGLIAPPGSLGAAIRGPTEVVGVDKDGVFLTRQAPVTEAALAALSVPQFLLAGKAEDIYRAATSSDEKPTGAVQPGQERVRTNLERIAERRDFSQLARDVIPPASTTAGRALMATGAAAADILTPDPFTLAAAPLKMAGVSPRLARALEQVANLNPRSMQEARWLESLVDTTADADRALEAAIRSDSPARAAAALADGKAGLADEVQLRVRERYAEVGDAPPPEVDLVFDRKLTPEQRAAAIEKASKDAQLAQITREEMQAIRNELEYVPFAAKKAGAEAQALREIVAGPKLVATATKPLRALITGGDELAEWEAKGVGPALRAELIRAQRAMDNAAGAARARAPKISTVDEANAWLAQRHADRMAARSAELGVPLEPRQITRLTEDDLPRLQEAFVEQATQQAGRDALVLPRSPARAQADRWYRNYRDSVKQSKIDTITLEAPEARAPLPPASVRRQLKPQYEGQFDLGNLDPFTGAGNLDVRYLPRSLRDELAQYARKAAKGATDGGAVSDRVLGTWAGMVTRGLTELRPGYFVNNMFGNTEQVFQNLGLGVAVKNAVRSELVNILPVSTGLAQLAAREGARAVGGNWLAALASTVPAGLAGTARGAAVVKKVADTLASAGDKLTRLLHLAQYDIATPKIIDAAEGAAKIAGETYTYKMLHDIAVRYGVLEGGEAAATKGLFANLPLPSTGVSNIAEAVGNRQRVGLFATLLDQGMKPVDAAEATVKALYDYRYSMSEGDRRTLVRVLVPFWRWQKNANRQLLGAFNSQYGIWRLKAYNTGRMKAADLIDSMYGDYDERGVAKRRMSDEEQAQYADVEGLLEAIRKEKGWTQTRLNRWLREEYDPSDTSQFWSGFKAPPDITEQRVRAGLNVAQAFAAPMQGDWKRDAADYNRDAALARVGRVDDSTLLAFAMPPGGMEGAAKWVAALTAAPVSAVADALNPAVESRILGYTMDSLAPDRAPVPDAILNLLGARGRRSAEITPELYNALSAIPGIASMLPADAEAQAAPTGRGTSRISYKVTDPVLVEILAKTPLGQLDQLMASPAQAARTSEEDPNQASRIAAEWARRVAKAAGLSVRPIRPGGARYSAAEQRSDRALQVPTPKRGSEAQMNTALEEQKTNEAAGVVP